MSFATTIIDHALESLVFNEAGLIPAIAQRWDTGEVLMLAWMNSDAVRETLESGRVTYWSRSRRALWRKGDTSGHVQTLRSFRVDCDGDTLLLGVEQVGAACHTNRSNCFYREMTSQGWVIISKPMES